MCAHLIWLNNFIWRGIFCFVLLLLLSLYICPVFLQLNCLLSETICENSFEIVLCVCVCVFQFSVFNFLFLISSKYNSYRGLFFRNRFLITFMCDNKCYEEFQIFFYKHKWIKRQKKNQSHICTSIRPQYRNNRIDQISLTLCLLIDSQNNELDASFINLMLLIAF